MANSYLTRTPSSAGNRKTWTWSAWIKRSSGLGSQQCLLACSSGATVFHLVYFDGNDKLVHNYNQTYCNTDRVFRDTSGWYHLVCAVDTTQSTASNRVKFYVNGVQETLSGNFPSQNTDMTINNNVRHDISNGGANFNGQFYFDGYMSHVAFVDGQQLTPTTFGETDSTSGIWKFKSPSGVTWGTNGFHLKFENSAALGTDSSGNSNTFTVNGNLKQALDTPSNVYATANPLTNLHGSATYSEGNLKVSGGSASNNNWQTTLGVSSGKWYWELKNLISDSDMSLLFYDQSIISGSHPGYGFVPSSRKKIINGAVTGSAIGSSAQNDIWSVALDLDNGKMFIARNGTYLESGNPSTGANPFIQTSDGLPSEGVFGGHVYNGSVELNFGNGFFGTTPISSAGSNGNGSLFEYDCPSGYYALNTKNINTYG